ncbi:MULTISPECIES: nuclear transport factor 2 family protein [unclassified Roseovarius]|uniref:nuclear transport factor 2 family protein n=1 Tax=unclassified Roseovarius TaxID=2614913 RepID=UPI0027402088|nr:nuclear transport factor 2 family protein [Roseovarius sp. MMSF_3350]
MTERTTEALRAKVQDLMKYGTSANMEELDKIYHEDIVVMDLSIDGRLVTLQKQEFMAMLKDAFKDKIPEDHMWSRIHSVTVDGDRGHVLISRKIPVGGPSMHIELSIDFIFEDGRWQVIREVNFSRPDAETA